MPAASLHDLCKKQALKMVNSIDDFGSMPFRVAEALLKKVQTAEQLHQIEINSPHFIGETRQIWLELVKRDIPNWRLKPHEPKNPASWYKVYKKLRAESDKEVDEDALILQATLKNLEEKKNERTSMVVDSRTVPKLPRMHGMRVEKGSSFLANKRQINHSDLRFTSGSKTKMATGKHVIERARREARERGQAMGKNSVLARPTHILNKNASSVYTAPQGLVESHRQSTTNSPPPVKVIAPRRSVANTSTTSNQNGLHKYTQEEREARLKAIAQGSNQPKSPAKTPIQAASTASNGESAISAPIPHGIGTKRKTRDDDRSIDFLFGDDGEDSDIKIKPSPMKRSKSSSSSDEERPKAFVKKPPVDIFMRKPKRVAR